MSLYAYPLSATASNACDPFQLQQELEQAGAIETEVLGVTVVDQLTIILEFAGGGLSPSELASVAAVVAAHTPSPAPAQAVVVTDRNLAYDTEGRVFFDNAGDLLLLRDS